MGRSCKGLQLSPSSLCDLEELSKEARSLGAADVVLRIRGLIMVSRQHPYRKAASCLNAGMKPNIKENPRNRKTVKRGRKRFFDETLYLMRFTIERVFAWEDKFKRLVLR